MSARAHVFLRL